MRRSSSDADVTICSKSFVSSRYGTTARPHCFTDEMIVRSQRARRPSVFNAARGTSVLLLTKGWIRRDAQHHRVTDHAIHLVAFQERLGERHRHRRLGRSLTRLENAHDYTASINRLHARDRLAPFPVEHSDGVPDCQSKNARQVLRFVVWHLNLASAEKIRDEEPVHAVNSRSEA